MSDLFDDSEEPEPQHGTAPLLPVVYGDRTIGEARYWDQVIDCLRAAGIERAKAIALIVETGERTGVAFIVRDERTPCETTTRRTTATIRP